MSDTSSQTGDRREGSQSGNQPEKRPTRFPLPPVKRTLGGIGPSRLGASQYSLGVARREEGKEQAQDGPNKTDEIRDIEGVLTGGASSYALGDSSLGGRYKVDPTLKTCFSAERDGADVYRLWA